MEQESFPVLAIREHAQRSFVPVKLRSDVNEELALGFSLSGLPASVIVAPSRDVIAVHQGYLDARELDNFLRDAICRVEGRREASRRIELVKGQKKGEDEKIPSEANKRPRTRPKTESRLALSGFCPVSLISDKRLVQGQAEYTVAHEGRLYRFANLLTFNVFRRDPERYVPVNGGYCPVARIERGEQKAGDPKFGVLYQGRLFLCGADSERQKFLRQPARYAVVDVAEGGFC